MVIASKNQSNSVYKFGKLIPIVSNFRDRID